jgi:ribonuclease T2
MSQRRRNTTRLSPLQLVILLALLAAFGAYRVFSQWGENPAPAGTEPAGILATSTQEGGQTGAGVLATDTPEAAGSTARKSTATPKSKITPTPAKTRTSTPGVSPTLDLAKFDYFVLSLSWSPDYCASSGGDDPQQCSIGKRLAFVLHGLWPQNNQGYPASCSTQKLPASVQAQFPGLYPSDSLFTHEWEKHGTCSGLAPFDYLTLTKSLRDEVVIPKAYRAPEKPFRTTADTLKAAFASANAPDFRAVDFETNCSGSGRYLKELYVCFSRDLQPMACGAEVHKSALKSCGNPDFLVRNIR